MTCITMVKGAELSPGAGRLCLSHSFKKKPTVKEKRLGRGSVPDLEQDRQAGGRPPLPSPFCMALSRGTLSMRLFAHTLPSWFLDFGTFSYNKIHAHIFTLTCVYMYPISFFLAYISCVCMYALYVCYALYIYISVTFPFSM